MSVRRKSIEYAAVAVVLSLGIIAASILITGVPIVSQSSGSSQVEAPSTLAIRLTDPPQVPALTSSLNLTYSSISLLVGEPTGTSGELTTKSTAVTPSGGSATIDLMSLQNVSETIALDQVEEAFARMERGEVLRSVVVL